MAINFPDPATQTPVNEFGPNSSPAVSPNDVLYIWDGVKWDSEGVSDLDSRFVNVSGDTMTGNLNIPSLNGGQLAGFRNVLINGNLVVNQRSLDVAAVPAGNYGQDRWKATAGGMTQIVEDGNYIPSADYTLSGTGVTTTTAISPASGNWDIALTHGDLPVTARFIQMELGTVATPFELRPIGTELSLCQRYYLSPANLQIQMCNASTATTRFGYAVWPSSMRDTPVVANINYSLAPTGNSVVPGTYGCRFRADGIAAAGNCTLLSFTADAEL